MLAQVLPADSAINALATEYSGKAIVATVDVDKAPEGGQVVDRVLGLVPKTSLAQKLDAALK